MNREIAVIKYQIGTYSGTIEINCNADDESEWIINRAKRILLKDLVSPMVYTSFRIIERRSIS